MENKFFILYCFIFIHLLSLKLALKCQENEIENCIKCETGENSDKCALCEDKYFLALNGEVCIKCDDDNYGMVGCSGSCTFMKELSNVKCQEDSCKTGYYEIVPGYCSICSLIEENCLECDYLKTNSEFKCKKCKDHYFPNNDGLCELCEEEDCLKCTDQNFCIECIEGKTAYPDGKCYLNIENCKIGIYSTEKNSPICIECNINYYPDSNGICQKCESELFLTSCHKCHLDNGKLKCDEGSINTGCSYFSKLSSCEMCSVKNDEYVCDECKEYSNSKLYITENGECRNCKSDSERGYCSVCSDDPKAPCDSCYKDSVLINDKCVRCDTLFDKCSMCSEKHCLKCYSGYGLLYEENCTSCIELFGEGCLSCGLNPYDGKPYCAECRYNYFYGVDGKCKNCKEDGNLANCKKCQELGKNGYICTQCENYYELLDGKCYKTCTIFEVRGIDGECRSCSSDEVGLSNCNQCQMMTDGQYKCSDCYYGYKLINGKCVQIEEEEIKICDEIENISTEESPIYSCINCPSNEYVQIKKENGAKICLKNSEYQDMNACKFGSIISEEEKKYICNKCINNSELVYDEDLKKNKCICNDGYFFDTSKKECRKCDELDSGCLKCNASIIYNGYYNFNCFQCDKNYAKNDGHCFYCYGNCEECNINEDGSQECLKYKEPYFLSNTSEIKKCNDYLQNCVSCSYIDEEKTELDCKRCVDNYFKNKNGECVECKEINDGCLVCSDDEERFKNIKCDKCKNNYFMTKENICEFCLSEKNGGNNCKECSYINTENEEEKIGCVKCIEPNYILLNGKCYSPIDNCKEYESYLNNNSEVKIRCKECNDKYELNKYYRCIKIKFYLQNCLKTNENVDNLECLECERGFDLIDKKCIDKTVSGDDEIKGCLNYETKYGYYYCVSCNNNYYLRNGNCVEKYKSNFLNDCKWSYFENGIFECNSCQGSSIKVSEHLLCNPQTVFNCDKLNNLGSELRPIYSFDNCKYYYNRIIMEDENGIKNCVYNIFDERCVEGKINTLYYNNTYTCTNCKKPYILSYSEFYERKICKDIYEEEKKSEFKIEDYESDQGIPIINGKCEDGYFTRNGKVCIKCNDVNIGMEGCGGKCDFKINREYQLKCEYNKCKEGYFEIIPGQCEKCENKLKGCNKCQYFENNENNYIILEPIRKRQLLCTDECQGKDIFKYDNKCLECKEIITNCEDCIKVNDEIKCQKAKDGYFIDNNGIVIQCPSNCNKCTLVNENNKLNIKCLMTSDSKYFINQDGQVKTCDDYYEGIDYCSSCSYNNDKLVCNICQSGYIELDDKCYSCKEILDNQGCKYCSKNYSDNSYYCYSCEDNNILIKNIGKCIPKNDEIKNCSNVNKISINEEEYFYECNSCNYDYKLVKNLYRLVGSISFVFG